TKGCNPPTNTKFCPSDNVTREQMSAFMHRLAINKVVDAKTAVNADNAADADKLDGKDSSEFLGKTEKAADSDKLDGKDSSAFLEKGTFVTTISGNAWEPWDSGPPSFSERHTSYTRFSGDGRVVIPLVSPAHIGGTDLGLESVQICFRVAAGAPSITQLNVWRTDDDGSSTLLLGDSTVRTVGGCYTYAVNRATASGIGVAVILSGGGPTSIEMSGVKATWATGSFPAGGESESSASSGN
ncbi:MAG: hypothetical protein U9N79_00455, partial [Actinomycetota bacterium]|nr:hypothetical protein [Actinomycetota bacterium]